MRERIQRAFSRARYAAIGAAIGAFVGGLFSRSTASSGGATGALIGALIAEKRHSASGVVERVKPSGTSESTEESEGGIVSQLSEMRQKEPASSD